MKIIRKFQRIIEKLHKNQGIIFRKLSRVLDKTSMKYGMNLKILKKILKKLLRKLLCDFKEVMKFWSICESV